MREKTERNKCLAQMHRELPELSYTQLGRIFFNPEKPQGISKQAVHQILKRYPEKPQNKILGALKKLFDGLLEGMK